MLDLDYIEDSNAHADANFVLLDNGNIAEAQATAEGATYDEEALLRLLRLARIGCNSIFEAQRAAVGRLIPIMISRKAAKSQGRLASSMQNLYAFAPLREVFFPRRRGRA